MKIDCEENPLDLIGDIGDPFFNICDETCDEIHRHPNHPNSVRIIDCEDQVQIDISAGSIEETWKTAQALCKLLNQDYRKKDDY